MGLDPRIGTKFLKAAAGIWRLLFSKDIKHSSAWRQRSASISKFEGRGCASNKHAFDVFLAKIASIVG